MVLWALADDKVFNRSFEVLWEEVQLGASNLEIDYHCANWLAMFEVWELDSTLTEPREEYHFELAREGVEKHIQKYVASVKSSTMTSKVWALPFPVAISDDLKSFAVLSEIFLQKIGKDLGLDWTRLMLPKNPEKSEDSEAPSTVSEQRTATPEKSSKKGSRSAPIVRWFELRPLYTIVFHNQSRTVLLQEKKALSTQSENSTICRLHIFSLIATGASLNYQARGFIGGGNSPDAFSHCSFHPELSILLFSRRVLLSRRSIEMWAYANCSLLNEPAKDAMPTTWAWPVATGVEALSFSMCGTQIVAKLCGKSRPVTTSIKDIPVAVQITKAIDLDAKSSHKRVRRATCDDSSKYDMQLERTNKNSEIDMHSSSLTPSSSQQLTFADHGKISISYRDNAKRRKGEIASVYRSGCEEVVQPLTRVPKWDGIEKVSITVESPGESADLKDHVKVFLNQHPDNFSIMEAELCEHLPAMITKNVHALETPTLNNLRHGMSKPLQIQGSEKASIEAPLADVEFTDCTR